jgi:small subunit ribosomal protein S18
MSLVRCGLALVGRRCYSSALVSAQTSTNEDPDAPITLTTNPYDKDHVKCILCKHGIKLDYKNSRLLQQFVSTFSGRVYERHVSLL